MDDARLRVEYRQPELSLADLDPDPFRQFGRWLDAATAAGVVEPNAMTVATADEAGRPSARTVLLKAFDARGFVFYTNYESRKGRQLAANPHAALVFWWGALQRQVLVTGDAAPTPAAESDAYFASRPLGARLGAWISRQSTVIEGREELERRAAAVASRFPDGTVPRPPFWGGFRLVPHDLEFWQGRANRLHDRLRYRRDGDGWIIERLSP